MRSRKPNKEIKTLRFRRAEALPEGSSPHFAPSLRTRVCCPTLHRRMMLRIFRARWLVALAIGLLLCARGTAARVKHNNNWAVIVDTSRFWFNARHVSNALTIYRSVRRMGIPDEQVKTESCRIWGGVRAVVCSLTANRLTPFTNPPPTSSLAPPPPHWCRLS